MLNSTSEIMMPNRWCQIYILNLHILQGNSSLCKWLSSLRCSVPWIKHWPADISTRHNMIIHCFFALFSRRLKKCFIFVKHYCLVLLHSCSLDGFYMGIKYTSFRHHGVSQTDCLHIIVIRVASQSIRYNLISLESYHWWNRLSNKHPRFQTSYDYHEEVRQSEWAEWFIKRADWMEINFFVSHAQQFD